MDMQAAIDAVANQRDLSHDQMSAVMQVIMGGQATEAQIGAFLIGLRMKGETVSEIAAAAGVMRRLATAVNLDVDNIVDTCGTGGDGSSTFNISTTSSFVAAASGAHVAKHGNRSASSKSGSADVLEAAGVRLDLTPEQIATCVTDLGIGFMFAAHHHSAMRFAIGPRRELGTRTVFNLLGPLTNPAGAPNQVIGVFSKEWVEPLAFVLRELGSNHVLVLHSEDGLDELSLAAPTFVAELRGGEVTTYTVEPRMFGLPRADMSSIRVDTVEESLAMMRGVLNGESGPARDIVLMNAGAAIYAAQCADDFAQGVAVAGTLLDSGEPARRLERLVSLTQSFKD
jgi:anthranilate phosphoribosyltransferase